jgi:hypothetical protein
MVSAVMAVTVLGNVTTTAVGQLAEAASISEGGIRMCLASLAMIIFAISHQSYAQCVLKELLSLLAAVRFDWLVVFIHEWRLERLARNQRQAEQSS